MKHNSNSMDRGVFSSHPDTTYPKKRTTVSYQNPTLQTPSSPKNPGTDAREDPHHQMTREITVEHAHKTLLPPCDEVENDTPITHRLIGSYHYDTCMYLCPYTEHRRRHGMVRGQPLTDPSPDTIPSICSPTPTLVASWPPPLQSHFESFIGLLCIIVLV